MRNTAQTPEMINPAMALPLGRLKTPINENNKPRNQRTKFTNGIQKSAKPRMDNTRPAFPKPFFCLTGWG